MRKTPIEHLPVVKAFAEYFIRKGKKDLKLKRKDYISASIDYTTRGVVYVWFFLADDTVTHITYKADGTKRDG